jgi:protein-tyrosine-phosphatase
MLEEAGYRVRSVGMHGVDGASASSGAVQAMKERGLDLSSHVSRSIDIGMVRQADHIWTMCQHHAEGVLQMVPTVRDRVERIGGDRDIEDPIGQPQGRYDECAQDLADALRRRFEEIEL